MAWDPRDQIAQDVALEVLLHGPLGRAELARRLRLAPATLTRVSADLIGVGLLEESGQHSEGRGRPSTLLQVVAEVHHFLGVKLSGGELTWIVTDLHGEPVTTMTAVAHDANPEHVAECIARIAEDARRRHSIDGIGIAIGGVVTPDGLVASAPFLGWIDVPLSAMVERLTGIPTSSANDLEAYTRAMHWFGQGAGHDSFAVLTVGAGVGFGCVANGRPLLAADSGVGLVGHWPLDGNGSTCSQGHRGCAEAMLTIPFIEREYALATGANADWEEILASTRLHDEAARRITERAGWALGKLIAAVANLTAPEVVILGGEGISLVTVAPAAVTRGMTDHRDPRSDPIRIEYASDSNEAWCRGAAVIALQTFVLQHGRAGEATTVQPLDKVAS